MKRSAIDDNQFFREATREICGSLDIETALQRTVSYLGIHMPAESLKVYLFEPALGAMRTIAQATSTFAVRVDRLTPMPEAARNQLLSIEPPFVRCFNRPEMSFVTRAMVDAVGTPSSSLLVALVRTESDIQGFFVLRAEGLDRYDEEHDLRRFSLLTDPFSIALSNHLRYHELLELKERLADDQRYLRREIRHHAGDEIIGADFGLRAVMEMIRHVAPLDSPVLLLGETGTGKDVLANAIHHSSRRRDGPFIKVNCGAIPESLVDSELFGHEKGAFTGALDRRRGLFERADGGTLFLDEIGELPLHAQVRLLRVLQFQEFERVGGSKPIEVNIRVVAATHRDLGDMVRLGRFREDLWFRLNLFPVMIPPLRQRKLDIHALVNHFILRKSRELKLAHHPTIAPGAIDRLVNYDWPGNVRELENVIERELILSRGDVLAFDTLRAKESASKSEPDPKVIDDDETTNLDLVMARHIRKILARVKGKVHGSGGAAELLGLKPSTLRHRMDKLGIPYGRRAK